MKQVAKLVSNSINKGTKDYTAKCIYCGLGIDHGALKFVSKTHGKANGYYIHFDEFNNRIGKSADGIASEIQPYDVAFSVKNTEKIAEYINQFAYVGIEENDSKLDITSYKLNNCQNYPLVFKTLVGEKLGSVVVTFTIHGTKEIKVSCPMRIAGQVLKISNGCDSQLSENVGTVFNKKVAKLVDMGCKVEW